MNTARTRRKLRVVVDTNVIISALNFGGSPARIIAMAGLSVVDVYISNDILKETAGVLKDKFLWSPEQTQKAIQTLTKIATLIEPTERVTAARDEDDNRILECALTARAEYLISGDNDLLTLKKYKEITIVSPARFLHIVQQ